jgi:hypothetical protein
MNRFFLMVCLWATAASLVACAAPPPVESEEVARFAIPPDRAFLAKRLVADVGIMKPTEQGWVVSGTQINVVEVSFPLMKEADVPDGEVAGRVILSPGAKARDGQRRSKSFMITLENPSEDPTVAALLERVAKSIERLDKGDFYRIETAWRSDGSPDDGPSMTKNLSALIDRHAQPLGAMLALVLAWLALLVRMKRRSMKLEWVESVRPTHLLPVALQLTLFLYWGLYDLSVGELLGDLVVQVAFAYGLEAWFLAWRHDGKIQIGASVLPIVGSMNLFVWFLGQDRWIALLTLTLAIASKHLIRRGGRHLFNPSGFGIAITGALCMLAPDTFGFFDLSHGFNAGPNMVELILILALIAQLRVPIVLVSIGGFIALLLLVDTQILTRPTALWGPVFLALCLLVTDPATIPKTPVGKLLFGAVYGSLMAVMATGLTAMGENDFFSKVFPLPLVNALVPRFDQWGSRAASWTRGVLDPAHNRVHVALWLVLVLGVLFGTQAKMGGFEHNRFDPTLAPRVSVDAQGYASCADNPAHCEAFSLAAELTLWSSPPATPPEAHRARDLPMNRSAMGILFLLMAALIAWVLDMPHAARDLGVRGGPGARATLLWLLGLCAVGLAVRLAIDPMFIREAFPLLPIPPFLDARLLGEAIDVYPQAPHLMAAAIAPLLSSDPVSSWFTANVVYGTLTIPAMFVLGTAASGRARVGLFAAALMALWPQHIRVSASESAHVALVLWATVAAAWSILAAKSGRLSAFVVAVTASCVLVMTRPEAALWGIAIVPLVLLSDRGVRERILHPSRLLFIAAGVWMVLPFLLATAQAPQAARLTPGSGMGESVDGSSLLELLSLLVTPDVNNAFFDAHTTPLWLWPLAVFGVCVGAKQVGRATLLAVTAVALSYLLLYAEMREAGVVWTKARYHAAALPAVALLAAWGLEDILARVPPLAPRGRRIIAVVALCALGVGAWWPGGGALPMDWQRELSWLHELGTQEPALIESGARIVTPDNRRRFLDQSPRSRVQLLTAGAQHADKAIPISHALERLEPMRLSTSVYYYRGLYCYLAVAPDGSEAINPQCAAMERAFELEAVAQTTVDAPVYQQAYVGVRAEGPIELGLFKIVRRRLSPEAALRGFPEPITEARTDVFPMGTNTPAETMTPQPPLGRR